MATDMNVWKKRVVDHIKKIADEAFQRKVWFGGGGGEWVDSPDEHICKFYDLLIEDILADAGNKLDEDQVLQLSILNSMMDNLVENTPSSIRPEDLIDDPRWVKIRKQAVLTLGTLTKND